MNAWIFGLTLLSLIFILIEILIVPGSMIVGILGAIALLVATFLMTQTYGPWLGLALFMGVVGISALAFVLCFRSSTGLVLRQSLTQEQKSYYQMGQQGTTLTDLRPSGKAAFVLQGKEQQVDVVTQGEFVLKDKVVEIMAIEGTKIVVAQKQ